MWDLLIDYLLFALLGVGVGTGLLIWGLGCKHIDDEFGQSVDSRKLTKYYAIMLLWFVVFWNGWISLVIERGTVAAFWLCLGWLAYFYWHASDKDSDWSGLVKENGIVAAVWYYAGIWLAMYAGVIFLVWLFTLFT